MSIDDILYSKIERTKNPDPKIREFTEIKTTTLPPSPVVEETKSDVIGDFMRVLREQLGSFQFLTWNNRFADCQQQQMIEQQIQAQQILAQHLQFGQTLGLSNQALSQATVASASPIYPPKAEAPPALQSQYNQLQQSLNQQLLSDYQSGLLSDYQSGLGIGLGQNNRLVDCQYSPGGQPR